MPYKYKDVYGWFTFEHMYKQMVDENNDAIFVEIGSFQGQSAVWMAEYIQETKKNIQFFCVDMWPDKQSLQDPTFVTCGIGQGEEANIITALESSLYHTFIKNLIKTNTLSNVSIIREVSWEAASLFEDNSIDFVYVDAGHGYDQVTNDIKAWYPKVKPGKVIGGHDFVAGVKKAVLDSLPFAVHYEPEPYSWFFRKPLDKSQKGSIIP